MLAPLCFALLLIAVAAFASDRPVTDQGIKFQRNTPVRNADGTFQARPQVDLSRSPVRRVPPEVVERFLGGNVCYFIRSYNVTRVDGTDETVPAGQTTCVPASRFQMKRAAPRK